MVIDDSDDEAPTAKSIVQPAEFAEQYEEVDLDEPYETVLKTLDIPTSSVISLSFPYVPSNLRELPDGAYPPIFKDRMIIAAVCKDFSVLVFTVPLSPPYPAVTNASAAGVQIIKLVGHHDFPSSVSITHTLGETGVPHHSRSRSRSRQPEETAVETKEWSLLVASTSPTGGGLLLLHEVGITKQSLHKGGSLPVQRQYLRSGSSCKVSFNTSVSPSARHSNLLVLYPSGIVKVYQCVQESNVRQPRSRRDSTGTVDSMTSRSSTQLLGGKFLVTLYAPFVHDVEAVMPRRKDVLDASWVLGGAAILALLEDGSWGIWDIEGAAADSSTKSQNLIQGQAHQTLLSGRSFTHLTIRGRFSPVEEPKPREGEAKTKPAKLAPMTPHTRKIKSDGLFSRESRGFGAGGPGLFANGGISVTSQNTRVSSSDESLLIYFGKQNVFISSLPSLLKSPTTTRSDADIVESSSASRPIPLNHLSLPTDLPQTSISQLLPSQRPSRTTNQPTLAFAANPTVPDIFLTTPHQLIFVCKPIKEPEPEVDEILDEMDMKSFDADAGFRQTLDFPAEEDQLLLTQGELDIDGMGRILDGMNKREGGFMEGTPTKQRATSAGRVTGTGRRGKITNGRR